LDATNLQTILWSSQLDSTRDAVGNYAKFVAPTVANGKVYLATFSGEVVVYGIVAPPDFSVTTAPSSQSITAGSSASYIFYVSPLGGFSGTVGVACSGLPSGASCSPSSISVPAGGAEVSTPLTVTTAASTPGGTSTLTITATSGSLVHTATASLTVMGFALTATALAPASIAPGGSATSTVTVAPAGGFNSTVDLTCNILPVTAVSPRCSLSSATVNGASGTPTLTVSTVATSASVRPVGLMYYAMLLPLCGLTLLGAKFRLRNWKPLGWLPVGLVLCGLIWLAACGSSSSGNTGSGGGTTAGSYTVTVTGTAGALVQTQNLPFTVQ
jgi:hypothetical protein